MSGSPRVAESPRRRADAYRILGLPAEARGPDVGRAYWRLAHGYHALAPADPEAGAMLDALNEAAEVLATPGLPPRYDALADTPPARSPRASARAAPPICRTGKLARFRRLGAVALLIAVASLASSPAFERARASGTKDLAGVPVTSAPIIFLGDSVTHGAGASSPRAAFATLLQERLHRAGFAAGSGDYDFVISALGGQAVDLRFAQDVGRRPRSLVVVEVGAHSVVEDASLSPQQYGFGYGLMLDCLQGTGATVVVSTVPWLDWDPASPLYQRAAEWSEIIREEAARRAIPVADVWDAMKGRPEFLADDEFHPNDAGHRLIADLYWQQIAPLLSRSPGQVHERCGYDASLSLRSPQPDPGASSVRGA